MYDWSDKRNYLVHYRMLKIFFGHGMEVEKVNSVISFKQSKWLEKYKIFNTQTRKIRLKMILKKTSINY